MYKKGYVCFTDNISMRCLYVRIDIHFCSLIRVSCNGTNFSVYIAGTVTLTVMAVTNLDIYINPSVIFGEWTGCLR